MTGLLRSLAVIWRGLRGARGYAVVATVSLGVGVAGVTLVFSAVRAVLLAPLPYDQPDRILVVRPGPPWELFERLQTDSAIFDGIAAYNERAANLAGPDEPQRILIGRISEAFLALTGVHPVVGRGFSSQDFQPGEDAALITDRLWRSRYQASSDVLGRALTLDDRSYRIVGVLPAGFESPAALLRSLERAPEADASVLVPLRGGARDRDFLATDVAWRGLTILARLPAGVGLERARAELATIAVRLPEPPGRLARREYTFIALPQLVAGDLPKQLGILAAAVALLLLIICANVANLVLARGLSRQREFGTRLALGASRRHLIWTVVSETLLLGAAGGVIGLVLAVAGARLLATYGAGQLEPLLAMQVDWRLMAFLLAITLFTAVGVAVVPAFHVSGIDPLLVLRRPQAGATWRRRHVTARALLVVSQVSLLFALLVGTGMLGRELVSAWRLDLGFRAERTLTAEISLSQRQYSDRVRVLAFFRELLERSRALPGVDRAALGSAAPGGPMSIVANVVVERTNEVGHADSPEEFVECSTVAGDYFGALGIPLLVGGSLEEGDTRGVERHAIVSEAYARAHWIGPQEALGRRLFFGGRDFTIVGVAGNIRWLDERAEPTVYLAYEQFPRPSSQMTIFLRTRGDPRALAAPLRHLVRSIDRNQPVYDVVPLQDIVYASLERLRALATMMWLFGAVTILVAAVGVFGAMSQSIVERRHELAVRLAVGGAASIALPPNRCRRASPGARRRVRGHPTGLRACPVYRVAARASLRP